MGKLYDFLHRDPRHGSGREGIIPNWMRLSLHYDFAIGDPAKPYLHRWYITPRLPLLAQILLMAVGFWLHHWWAALFLLTPYLHHFLRSDDDRALHDHPADNLSIILVGSYGEFVPDYGLMPKGTHVTPDSPVLMFIRRPGEVVLRPARRPHRIVISSMKPGGVWSLFVFGPKLRTWGFWCPWGWRHWAEFTGGDSKPGVVGKGCE